MPGHLEFEFNIRGKAAGRRRSGQPFNLLILGNFSGHAAEPAGEAGEAIAKRRIVHLDLDNVDELWSLFSPYLQLQLGPVSIELSPGDINGFHPDQLYRTLPVFDELRELRKKLLDPGTAQSALDEILSAGAVIEGEIVDDSGRQADVKPAESSLAGGAGSSPPHCFRSFPVP